MVQKKRGNALRSTISRSVALAAGTVLSLGGNYALAAGQCVAPDNTYNPSSDSLPSELLTENTREIFSANFDNLPDFINGYQERCEKGTEADCAKTPAGFTHYRSGERFHPIENNDSSKHASIEITNFQGRGGTGKSFVVWDESYGGPSTWGSDSQLTREFSAEYRDVYYEFWIKFQPGYRWAGVENGGGRDLGKISRIIHYDQQPNTNIYKFFSGGVAAPVALMDIAISTKERNGRVIDRVFFNNQIRCDPQESNYKCGSWDQNLDAFPSGEPTFVELLGDGSWHKLGMRVTMNSAPGIRDGRLSMWIDNTLVQEDTDVPYIGLGGDPTIGWNTLMIGGNMHNLPEPESAQFEQWYAIDDVRAFSIE